MSTSPSNLRLALEAYDAQQRRQAALLEAERIGTLIHIQEQQLLAAKHLAKQRKSQRRRRATTPATTTTTAGLAESAVDDEEEDLESVVAAAATAPTPIPASLAARRAARSAAKRASLLPPMPVLESIPEPEFDEHSLDTDTPKFSQIARFASHKRRPNEPYAALASRSQWKPDSHARVCDNVLCRTPFTLFGPQSRHHCRRCGNVFCSACLTHTEVLYDMERSKWDRLPEALLASIFPSEPSPAADQHQQQDKLAVPTSPASSNLSSSLESGSSRASSSSYFASQPCLRQPISDPLHTVHRVPRWRSGTDEALPTPIPSEWRDHLLEIATEEKVCEECHDELWDQPTPFERHNARRAFNREREEMAWALTVLGLDKWDEILREHDLTLKPMPRERKEKKFRRVSSHSSSGTVTTSAHASSTSSHCTTPHWSVPVQGSELPAGVPGIRPEEGLDYLDRPTYPHVYAWVTPPTCIRFTSGAFKSSSSSATHPYHAYEQQLASATPSPFGMLKSPAKFLPPPLPASYLAAQAVQAAQAAAARVPTGEEREDLRQHAYKAAVKDFVRAAYLKGVPCDHLDGGVMGVRFVVDPTPMQALRTTMEKKALDLAARWRGDPVGDA